MSGKCFWNPAIELDKVEMPDMSGQSLWNPARRPDIFGLTGVFGGRIDF
jgi:hypothetical protein